jgi:hypothetical protein
LDVLKQLECKFPNKSTPTALSRVAGVVRIKTTVKSRTAEKISKVPFMTDAQRIENIKFLDRLTTYCYHANSALIPLVIFPSLKLTIQFSV